MKEKREIFNETRREIRKGDYAKIKTFEDKYGIPFSKSHTIQINKDGIERERKLREEKKLINQKLKLNADEKFNLLFEFEYYQNKKDVFDNIFCIPQNSEKYISITIGQLRFIDSLNFMSTSLEKLVAACPKESFKLFKNHFKDTKTTDVDLLLKKGIYPYEYMDSFERFKETQLPPRKKFYSGIKLEGIKEDEYAHAQKVWETFHCKTMGDYHDLYVTTDTLLLADVFQNFRRTCKETYRLDPANYLTAPGLAWDALLLHSKIELELLTDVEKYLFFEKGKRGGYSSVGGCRHHEANNKYLTDYDPQKETSYLLYLDANNLYGWAMSQSLPYADFEWLADDQVANLTTDDILGLPDENIQGCMLEVDLDYPQELHDLHSDFPLAPENLTVPPEWLSPYQNNLLSSGEKVSRDDRLIASLHPRKKYVVHYKTLKLFLSLGLKLTRVHRVLRFKQKPWMRSYIDKNTQLRKTAKSDFEKDFYKLMNNSVFGKTMENVRNRIDGKIIIDDDTLKSSEKVLKLASKPNYKTATKFKDSNLGFFERHKEKTYLNKPIYCGVSILDLSKSFMYDFYYHHLKKTYKNKITLMYTDTDSLLCIVKVDDIYEDIKRDAELYDFSNYSVDHHLYDPKNKKVIGKMKDEYGGKVIKQATCLRSKMYSIIDEDDNELKKAKGITRVATKKNIKAQDYYDCLKTKKSQQHRMTIIQSNSHVIYTLNKTKISLSPWDGKRYILADGIQTLPYGHFTPGVER